jgi:hypothetical protein
MKARSIALMIVIVAGCSAARVEDDDSAATSSQLRAIAANELLGEIGYGETKEVDYSPTPKYRAYWFRASEGDQVQVQVVTRDATDPVLWLTDESFNVVAMNDNVRATDANAQVVRFLPKTGKYFLVFREMNSSPRAKFSVSVRKLGALPLDCDPDGEGIFSPDCTDPPEIDVFDPTSCAGPQLSVAEATNKFAAPDGLRLGGSRIYYRTRQCKVTNGAPDCSPWVRAYGMDVKLASIAPSAPDARNAWTITASATPDTTRKVKIDFSIGGAENNQFCVDGPFTNVRGTQWSALEGSTPGICMSRVPAKVTAGCVRLEPGPIQLSSGNPSYYTEFGAVLLARY